MFMHERQKEMTLQMLSRYVQGEEIPHNSMRIVASDILEMYTQQAEELKELETEYHELFFKGKKEEIREKFLADPSNSFAVAYRLVLEAAANESPQELIMLIGEVAKEFDVDISDCSME